MTKTKRTAHKDEGFFVLRNESEDLFELLALAESESKKGKAGYIYYITKWSNGKYELARHYDYAKRNNKKGEN